jgi:hypothetical protein
MKGEKVSLIRKNDWSEYLYTIKSQLIYYFELSKFPNALSSHLVTFQPSSCFSIQTQTIIFVLIIIN